MYLKAVYMYCTVVEDFFLVGGDGDDNNGGRIGFVINDLLCRYITQEGHKLEIAPKVPMTVTNAVSWRSEGIKYRKNEVFLDVVESVNLLVSLYINETYSMFIVFF